MNIRLERGSERRFAYTDRKGGWLELSCGMARATAGGYFRGERRYLSDFFLSVDRWAGPPVQNSGFPEAVDLYRTNADHTVIRPDGFSVFFDGGHLASPGYDTLSLEVSLLLDERSLYLSSGPSSVSMPVGLGLLCESSGHWTRAAIDGVTVVHDGRGMAVASTSRFELEAPDGGRIILRSGDARAEWYVSFENDCAAACALAARLAHTSAIQAHRAAINSFLSGFASDSGDAEFDEAVRWAQFSGWLLANDELGPGLWAGLPWLRERWARDTFVSLTGLFLVSGRFAEARSILTSFASKQNRDPHSADYGRLPNRYRGDGDIIYNSADGTLWFIRALWEYAQYTGDLAILAELRETVDCALESDERLRVDADGFLRHGDADTWMDARVRGGEAWAPRGDRACEIQALRYTALRIGARMARLLADLPGSPDRDALLEASSVREGRADKLRSSFRRLFWCPDRKALADRLPPGREGEWLRDFRVRPNQLLAASVPLITGDSLLDETETGAVLDNVWRELASPFGFFTLCPDDPLFHPDHENNDWHHKDAACHNGTVWPWLTGAFVSASAASARSSSRSALGENALALLRGEVELLFGAGCAGTLSGTVHAKGDQFGRPVPSGLWSHAMGLAEFARNVYQDLIGFRPFLTEGRLELRPRLPSGVERWSSTHPFGADWSLKVETEKLHDIHGTTLRCRVLWQGGSDWTAPRPLTLNGTTLRKGIPLELTFPSSGSVTVARSPVGRRTSAFPRHEIPTEWCGAVRHRDYLERLIGSGGLRPRGAGVNSGPMEWYFDSDFFRKKYDTALVPGAVWSADSTTFRLWSPTAREVSLLLYADGRGERYEAIKMAQGTAQSGGVGVWAVTLSGDLHGTYYRFRIRSHGLVRDCADPYARACGLNGQRSLVLDRTRSLPDGWEALQPPSLSSPNDAVVYEVHIADLTSSPSWNGDSGLRRTYLGAAETGTTCGGYPSGFDHIKSLGVTHVQFLPIFDFGSVDEALVSDPEYSARPRGGLYNWGYDPANYGCPEGSYSTDPTDGELRVGELKRCIARYLQNGIGVIMDVVLNHVPSAQNHPLGIGVDGYYFRLDSQSGAGDDTASERFMFRAYMIDVLRFWLSEYKLSGFRFDLMGLHDVETMNAVAEALRSVKADVLLYGEGWDMYRGRKMVAASMLEARKLRGIGFFNDAFRCAVKGPVFASLEGGFIHDGSRRESLKFGLVGAVYHPQVHNHWVEGTANPNPWTDRTAASVNYVEIHDNLTLFDKLQLVESDREDRYYELMQRSAIALVLLAQGQPVLHAGMEFMRTKEIPPDLLVSGEIGDLSLTPDGLRAFSHNSYNLCDRVNGLDWERCSAKQDLVAYVRALIAVRRAHPLFRLRTSGEVVAALQFVEGMASADPPDPEVSRLLAWTIDGAGTGDSWKSVCVAVNPASGSANLRLPQSSSGGRWHLIVDGWTVRREDSGAMEPSYPVAPGTIVPIEGKALYLYAEF